ncbi:MAG: anti-sigma B factor antagonist [Myxococcota bacterium]|jgi:anti-sigma B factor antagonist
MDMTTFQEGNACVLNIAGSLDTKTCRAAEDRINELMAAGNNRLVVDLEELDYISSAGLRVLLFTMKKLKKSKGKLAICGMNPTVQEVFDISGFSKIFSVFPKRPEAVASV